MAVKDSDELKTDERYPLGDYSFRIERTSVPGSSNDKIEAICTKGGKNARKSIQVPSSTQLLGWYVEANETTADVYAIIKKNQAPLVIGEINSTVISGPVVTGRDWTGNVTLYPTTSEYFTIANGKLICAVKSPVYPLFYLFNEAKGVGPNPLPYTYDGQTVYYGTVSATYYGANTMANGVVPISEVTPATPSLVAWSMLYASDTGTETEVLVGRFAIELEDAGGVGPGSDWDDPGDYDPDWEEGDPTHTLYVTVTGALSGRHNDPIVDPSYSYIPADKDTVKDYGCGGDGGHGGGGGAGASTVVVHKFATNQANSKDVAAIARRHGYGSGGGKGGKGGDGCILVYY